MAAFRGFDSAPPGSIDSHTAESKRVGVDVLWWSDHDWRIEAYRHASRFSFDALTEPIGKLEPWTPNSLSETRVTKYAKFARKGTLDAYSDAIDTGRKAEGTGSLLLTAAGCRSGGATACAYCAPRSPTKRASARAGAARSSPNASPRKR